MEYKICYACIIVGKELIQHIKRADGPIIPEYRHDIVDKVMKYTDALYSANLKTSQLINEPPNDTNTENPRVIDFTESDSDSSQQAARDNIDIGQKLIYLMQVRHVVQAWNKRSLIAYHNRRIKKLKLLRWEYGNNLPSEIVINLSKDELEWFTRYNENLFGYMSILNDGRSLDLTLHVQRPAIRLNVEVRCLKDYGQLELENEEPVMLTKGTITHLPLSQCEKLIHQGVLEQM